MNRIDGVFRQSSRSQTGAPSNLVQPASFKTLLRSCPSHTAKISTKKETNYQSQVSPARASKPKSSPKLIKQAIDFLPQRTPLCGSLKRSEPLIYYPSSPPKILLSTHRTHSNLHCPLPPPPQHGHPSRRNRATTRSGHRAAEDPHALRPALQRSHPPQF